MTFQFSDGRSSRAGEYHVTPITLNGIMLSLEMFPKGLSEYHLRVRNDGTHFKRWMFLNPGPAQARNSVFFVLSAGSSPASSNCILYFVGSFLWKGQARREFGSARSLSEVPKDSTNQSQITNGATPASNMSRASLGKETLYLLDNDYIFRE
jgi:hypothetical protein